MKRLKILLIVVISTTLFNCSKNSDRNEDTTTNSSLDYAFGQSVVYDAFKIVHQAANSSKGIANVNLVDTVSNPMSITIQFNGICSGNGLERTGSITATFSSKYDVIGCVTSITFSNYSYKGYAIGTGTIGYTRSALNSYSYTVNNVSIAGNKTMYFSGNQNITISSGETTASVTDDSYIITGSASGATFAGNEFSAAIDTDLILAGNCEWIGTGIVTVTPENKTPRVLDFGSGCDNAASVTVYSVVKEIVIP
jgi:hypothetical protein